MMVVANGKQRDLAAGTTVRDLLAELALEPERVVVEHNGNPLGREHFAQTELHGGDRLEIAQMVGGG